MGGIALLRSLIDRVPARLETLSSANVSPVSEPKWSAKEELGHLLDSAANNHQRIVRAQLEDKLDMPGYAQREWVEIHKYKTRDWRELIALWTALNRQLLTAAEAVPPAAWAHTLKVAGSGPLTLQFVFDDYLEHMLHHLGHIGIDTSDLKTGTAAAD